MSPVRYELEFYIPEDGLLYSEVVNTLSITLTVTGPERRCGSAFHCPGQAVQLQSVK
jgi:hypothetical protein